LAHNLSAIYRRSIASLTILVNLLRSVNGLFGRFFITARGGLTPQNKVDDNMRKNNSTFSDFTVI
jgi:hypothetical protein